MHSFAKAAAFVGTFLVGDVSALSLAQRKAPPAADESKDWDSRAVAGLGEEWSWSAVAGLSSSSQSDFKRATAAYVEPSQPHMAPTEHLDVIVSCLAEDKRAGLARLTEGERWRDVATSLMPAERKFVEKVYYENKLLGVMVVRCTPEQLYQKVLPFLPPAQRKVIEQESGHELQLSIMMQGLVPSLHPDEGARQEVAARMPAGASADEHVCISLSVYEEVEWVDSLLKEALYMMEPDTVIMMHMHSAANYTDADFERWNNLSPGRIYLNSERLWVDHLHGSILYTHLSNTRHLEEVRSGYCKYVIFQASNQRWLRQGVEAVVRERRVGGIIQSGGTCSFEQKVHPWEEEFQAPRKLWGWGAHEGAYYPTKHVLAFHKSMLEYLGRTGENTSAITNYRCFCEECWLQTWMLNNVDLAELEEYWPNVAERYLGDTGASQETVDEIVAGEHTDTFGVKRVSRDMDDPITRSVLALSA